MSKVINSALELIGNTPLLNASRYAKNAGIEGVTLLTKLEYLNPAGSVKKRCVSNKFQCTVNYFTHTNPPCFAKQNPSPLTRRGF